MMRSQIKFHVLSIFTASLLAISMLPNFAAAASVGGRFKKVVLVIFENTDYADAARQPDFKNFATRGALLTNFYAEVHPSQGNYIALTAGDTHGVDNDRPINLNIKHIGDLLEAQGKNWKAYAEGYPGNCFLGASRGKYARKHVPFVSFTNVTGDKSRCRHITNETEFDQDVAANTLPEFSLYVPDLDNDGHDTNVDFAGKWFAKKFEPLLRDSGFMRDTLVVVTFDESGKQGGNQIFTAVFGPSVKTGAVDSTRYTHYSLLRTLEDEFGVGTLGAKDASALAISGVW